MERSNREIEAELQRDYRDFHATFDTASGRRVLAKLMQFTSFVELDDPRDFGRRMGKEDVIRYILETMGYANDLNVLVAGILSAPARAPELPDFDAEEE